MAGPDRPGHLALGYVVHSRRYRAAVPVYLVRHGHAGSRAAWEHDDDLRPLSAKGASQARWLVAQLGAASIGPIVSSPARRCVETVEPLAAHRGCSIDLRKELLEGEDPDVAVQLALDLAPSNPLLCSHGDIIPKMIRRLVAEGMRANDANRSQKGSLWVIEVRDGRPIEGRYYPPGRAP